MLLGVQEVIGLLVAIFLIWVAWSIFGKKAKKDLVAAFFTWKKLQLIGAKMEEEIKGKNLGEALKTISKYEEMFEKEE